MTARLLRSPFVWLVLILVGLEGAASRLLPYRRLPTARVASRNALTKEGWPECTAGDRARSGKLAVIISHSQGVGIEIASASRIYAALLREQLRHARPADSLENWSSPGLRTADLEVLSLRAPTAGPTSWCSCSASPTSIPRGRSPSASPRATFP